MRQLLNRDLGAIRWRTLPKAFAPERLRRCKRVRSSAKRAGDRAVLGLLWQPWYTFLHACDEDAAGESSSLGNATKAPPVDSFER